MADGTKTFYVVNLTTVTQQLIPARGYRASVIIYNAGSDLIWLSNQSAVNPILSGLPVPSGTYIYEFTSSDAWYARANSLTANVRIVEAR